MSFKNKVVIVTGSSSGIGAATALLFAKEGANVVIVGRNETRLNSVAEKISKIGSKPVVVNADVGKDEDAKQIILRAVGKFGKIDVLVNNAGIIGPCPVDHENVVQKYDSIIQTNLRSVVLLTSLATPHLKKTKGNIINVSSVAGKSAVMPGNGPYGASKAALDHYSRSCAMELAAFGIRVNIVSPGPVKTNIGEAAGINIPDDVVIEMVKKMTALRTYSEPEEVADVIMFLASNKARSITGSDYYIDSGCLVNPPSTPAMPLNNN